MNTKLKASFLAVGCALALNFTAPGRAFAVWCQADAPMVYSNILTEYMPFLFKTVTGTGTSTEDAVTQAGAATRAEILKASVADKAVTEGIAAYEAQEQLRVDAIDLAEQMKQPANTCQAMATSANMTAADQVTQTRAFQMQASIMAKVNAAATPSTLAALDTSYKTSSANFCTPEEAALGVCKTGSTPAYAHLAGADQDALFLFQSKAGSSSYEGDGKAQDAAIDGYISRVTAGVPAQALPGVSKEVYSKSPQARAYVELARRYNAYLSVGTYSLNQIRALHNVQPNLGNDTMLATVSAPGFEPNKADMSQAEVIERFVASKFTPEAVRDLATATKSNLILRDMNQMNSFQLRMSYEAMLQSSRTESLMAHQLALMAEQTLRPQLDAQRVAAARANATTR